MQQPDGCAGPAHQPEQARLLRCAPRARGADIDLTSPTFACVPPAETNMPILRACGQFERLSVLRVMHGLRAAQHSMMCVRA